jgi:Zn-dependent protease with chaperone function
VPDGVRDVEPEAVAGGLPVLPGQRCPQCGASVADGGAWVTWCEACEWNLQIAMPERPMGLIARREHQLMAGAAARMHDDLITNASPRRRMTAASLSLLALAVAILGCVLLLAVGVLWVALVGSGFWRWPAVLVGGLLLWLLVPRPARVRKNVVLLARADAPELWRLVDAVAAGLGTQPPDLLGVDTNYNAYVVQVGWRRRRLLVLGLALWSAEEPQERVATLGHELGHLRHRDTRRMLVTVAGRRVLHKVITVLLPNAFDRWAITDQGMAIFDSLANVLRRMLALPLVGLFLLAARLDSHESQRAEYLADLASVRLAGREAAAMSLHRILAIAGVEARLGAAVRRGEDPWATLDATAAPPERELRRLLLASERRGHSVDSSHPPTHLRVSLVRSRSDTDGEIHLDAGWTARIAEELAPTRARLRRRLRDDMLDR